ncbi:MAG: VWA domain-containing protein [Bacteroidales bacterium]|nr:VWA domain-containing protein [Bacteroidales bacterium]
MDNLNLHDFNIDFGNFDPGEISSDETINAVLIVDVSPSVAAYVKDMNTAFKDFLEEMQKSHVAEKLMVSIIEFNEKTIVRSGFQPVSSIDPAAILFRPCGSGTALYDAVLAGITNALNYRTNLENSGVNCNTLIFIITDGEDNSSGNQAAKVRKVLDDTLKGEKNAFSFESILFGVGNDADFEKAQKDMGIRHLAKIGNSGKEIRKMIGFISASISKSSGTNVQVVF